MSENSQHLNKDRSSNFCKEETSKLMLLLKDYPVITCKKTDHASNHQKEAAWRLLTEKFNSDATRYRTTKQLQQKYNNMKKTARKEMAAEKYGRRLTGGGPPPPKPSETTEWLNSIMGESISGLPAVYDSDAMDKITVDAYVEPVDVDTTAKVNVDLSGHEFEEERLPLTDVVIDSNIVLSESCEFSKEPEVNESLKIGFDSSTPKAMLRKPVSKELSFDSKKRKAGCTPAETRRHIILQSQKKVEFINEKQIRERDLALYAKEENDQNMRHRQELHDMQIDFQRKINALMLEKCKYEMEKAKIEFNKVNNS